MGITKNFPSIFGNSLLMSLKKDHSCSKSSLFKKNKISSENKLLLAHKNVNIEYPEIDNTIGITDQEQLLFKITLGNKIKFTQKGVSKIIKPGSLTHPSILTMLNPTKKYLLCKYLIYMPESDMLK